MAGPGSAGALRPGTGTGAERRRPPPAASPALRRARHRLRVSAGAAAPMRGRAGPIRPARSAQHGAVRGYRCPRYDPFAFLSCPPRHPPGGPGSTPVQQPAVPTCPCCHPPPTRTPSSNPIPRDPQRRDGDDVDRSTLHPAVSPGGSRVPPLPSCTQRSPRATAQPGCPTQSRWEH